MSVKLSPIGNDAPFLDASGNPLNGGFLYTYTAGSSTPLGTYTTSAGNVSNANPIVLNANGYPSNGSSVVSVWLTAGSSYKFELQTSAGVTVWTRDNISGINDTSVSTDEWSASGLTPTYVSTTSFTLAGDQTTNFHVGRRLQFTVTAGTVYGRILTTAYGALTTVTLVMDGSQVLDSGLSAVSLAVLRNNVLSVPYRVATAAGTDTYTASVGASRYVIGDEYKIKIANSNLLTTSTLNLDSLGAKNIKLPSGLSIAVGQLNGEHTFRYDGTNMLVLNPLQAAAVSPRSYLAGCTISNGTDTVNDINIAAGECTDSTNVAKITVTAMTGKQLDVGWAPGGGAGMRNSAVAIANGTYHIYAVSKADGTQDIYAHTSTTVATVITALQLEAGGASYVYARRIGSIVRSGATILQFTQDGDYFRLAASVSELSASPGDTNAHTLTLAAPPVGLNVFAILTAQINTAGGGTAVGYLSDLAATDEAASIGTQPLGNFWSISANPSPSGHELNIRTNTSAQVRYRINLAGGTVYIASLGWIDRRGRDA